MANRKKPRRLFRSRNDRFIAGVCGGIAEYFNIDPSIVRILFIVFLICGGGAFLVYIVLWIAVPVQPLKKRKSSKT